MFFKIIKKVVQEKSAREWSNEEIKKIAPYFKGSVLNLSGGSDSDKYNSFYQKYFISAKKYDISNYYPNKPILNKNNLNLDLEKKFSKRLLKNYDLVFSHTVLEHVFDISTAIKNICSLSRHYVLTIVPFLQSYHHEKWYNDYWRFTPQSLVKLFFMQGFRTIYLNWNEASLGNIYICHLCAKTDTFNIQKKINKIKHKFGPGHLRDAMLFGSYGQNHIFKT